jgi:hypothetical protein
VEQLPYVIAMAVAGFFVCGLYVALSSHVSGWRLLAEHYRFNGQFTGTTWHCRAATFRSVTRYWPTLVIGASTGGLYLAQLWPFSTFGHPPLLVPWRDIKFAKRRWFYLGSSALFVGRDRPVRISLSKRIVANLMVIAGTGAISAA